MCNLYSMTKSVEAMRRLFPTMRDHGINLPSLPGTLTPHGLLDQVQPQLRSLADEPELEAAYRSRCANRASFNARLAAREPEAVAMGWQRTYMRGENAAGDVADFHLTKRRMCPVTGRVSGDVD